MSTEKPLSTTHTGDVESPFLDEDLFIGKSEEERAPLVPELAAESPYQEALKLFEERPSPARVPESYKWKTNELETESFHKDGHEDERGFEVDEQVWRVFEATPEISDEPEFRELFSESEEPTANKFDESEVGEKKTAVASVVDNYAKEYFGAFPQLGELTVKKATVLKPSNFENLIDFMLASDQKNFVIDAHGEPSGLFMPLANATKISATKRSLFILTRIEHIRSLIRAAKEHDTVWGRASGADIDSWRRMIETMHSKAWQRMIGPEWPTEVPRVSTVDEANRLIQSHLKALVDSLFPGAVSNRQDRVDRLINKMLRLQAKRIREIQFRACNIGKDSNTLYEFRKFFGADHLCAPDVRSFMGFTDPNINRRTVDRLSPHPQTQVFTLPSGRFAIRIIIRGAVASIVSAADTQAALVEWVNGHLMANSTYRKGRLPIHLLETKPPVFPLDSEYAGHIKCSSSFWEAAVRNHELEEEPNDEAITETFDDDDEFREVEAEAFEEQEIGSPTNESDEEESGEEEQVEWELEEPVVREDWDTPQDAKPEILLVAGANYPSFKQEGNLWKRSRSLSAGPWREFSLRLAAHRLKNNPKIKVTLFDFLLGTRENITLDAKGKPVAVVEKNFNPPIADDYWNLVGIEWSQPTLTQILKAMIEPANKNSLSKKAQVSYFDGANALSNGKSLKLTDYIGAVNKVASPVISITDVYAYIESFKSAGKAGALTELHFFAHAFNVSRNQYSGGPILLNSLDNPIATDRVPLDKDARSLKDFTKPTMDPVLFAKAFAANARSFVWGCNFQRGFIRQFVNQVGKNHQALTTSKAMKISYNSDWGEESEFRAQLGLSNTAIVKNVSVDQAKVEQILRNANLATYMQKLALATGRPVIGGPPGTYADYDGGSSPLKLMHIPMTNDSFRNGNDSFERALLFFRDHLGYSFDAGLGDHNGLGRGYMIYKP